MAPQHRIFNRDINIQSNGNNGRVTRCVRREREEAFDSDERDYEHRYYSYNHDVDESDNAMRKPSVTQNVFTGPSIRLDDSKGLQEFSDDLWSSMNTLTKIGELDTHSHVEIVAKRFTGEMLREYQRAREKFKERHGVGPKMGWDRITCQVAKSPTDATLMAVLIDTPGGYTNQHPSPAVMKVCWVFRVKNKSFGQDEGVAS
ncbi:hypothetical protein Pcinc_030849 [Petrolisthes cinctipes]|uniref:Uncharacterized protein n=1 Tax=Petrolisthes cinctipes TaxID=88211 RepID=A0AAE1K206_PETCI|nr:hypothetical protein Pcinc_030849 [Petrolisthes cinctipes]